MKPFSKANETRNPDEADRVPLMYRDVPEVRTRLLHDLSLNSDEDLFRYFDIDFRWVGLEWVGPELMISETEKKDHGVSNGNTRPPAIPAVIGMTRTFRWNQFTIPVS